MGLRHRPPRDRGRPDLLEHPNWVGGAGNRPVVRGQCDRRHRQRGRLELLDCLGEAARTGRGPLAAVQEYARREGGGVYLGLSKDGSLRFARAQRAVLLLGPPRSGKTSAIIIPALIAHTGPAVSTSTKLDVAGATWPARQRSGRLWEFNPTGSSVPSGLEQLRWSPVRCSRSWEGALLMARAMTAGVGTGTTHGSHWAKRSQALLAPLLHAAALDGRDMETGWTG
jgi:type IV secretion system protein VirD4